MESSIHQRTAGDRTRVVITFTLLVLGVVGSLACSSRDAVAAPLTIEVDDAQNVTLVGSSDSLRTAVMELCRRGQIELVAYEAEDRPITAAYRKIPMVELLGRLLRPEIYVVGLRASGSGDQPLVTWLRVSGSTGGVLAPPSDTGNDMDPMPAPPTAAASAIDLGVAPNVIELALTSNDSSTRQRARQTIAETIRDNQLPLQRYLRGDVEQAARDLAPFAYSGELLSGLLAVTQDVHERGQLQTILQTLQLQQGSGGRRTFVQ